MNHGPKRCSWQAPLELERIIKAARLHTSPNQKLCDVWECTTTNSNARPTEAAGMDPYHLDLNGHQNPKTQNDVQCLSIYCLCLAYLVLYLPTYLCGYVYLSQILRRSRRGRWRSPYRWWMSCDVIRGCSRVSLFWDQSKQEITTLIELLRDVRTCRTHTSIQSAIPQPISIHQPSVMNQSSITHQPWC